MEEKDDFGFLPRDQRAHIIRALFETDKKASNRKVARRLHTTRGMVAAIRRDYHIPSRGPSFEEMKKRPKPKVRPKIAPNEAAACTKIVDTEGHQCPYLPVPGSDRCTLHPRLKKKRRSPR